MCISFVQNYVESLKTSVALGVNNMPVRISNFKFEISTPLLPLSPDARYLEFGMKCKFGLDVFVSLGEHIHKVECCNSSVVNVI